MSRLITAMKRKLRRVLMTPAQRRADLVGPPEFWEMKRQFQIDFLKRMGLQPEHYLVDIGCGVLRGGVPIIDYLDTGHYYGIEARADVLAEGRKELEESGLEHKKPNLLHAQYLADVSLGRKFDYIWAFSVLIHLSDDILEHVMRFVANHLDDHSVFYANVNTSESPDGVWQQFPGVSRPLSFYADVCQRHGLRMTGIGSLADFGHITGGEPDLQPMLEIRKA